MKESFAKIVDDTGLYDGIKNLASGYFDTVAEYNQAHTKQKHHFSFQTVKDMNWKTAVAKILGRETIEDVGEQGKSMLKTFIKTAVGAGTAIAAPELEIGELAVGMLSDLVIDKAVEAFAGEGDVVEVYEKGTWLYVSRGKEHHKLRTSDELVGESALFQEWGDKMEARDLYSPAFYISHLTSSSEDVVYLYDTEETATVSHEDIRVADPTDKLRFDNDSGMTLIRELYFRREQVKSIQYPKFQVGDEVSYRSKTYTVTGGDASTITLRDRFNNTVEADPQGCTAGPRDNWRAETADMFRTVSFTFSVGDFAYRPLAAGDVPPTKRAKGVLCCIFFYNGERVEVFDCWTGESSIVFPNELVKPPLTVRQLMNNMEFTNFQKRVMKRLSPEHHRLTLHTQHEEVCWGYNVELEFADTRVLTADRTQTQVTIGAKGATAGETRVTMEQTYVEPGPTVDRFPTNLWVAGGLILGAILIL